MIEEWRPIPGYEGIYDVSNLGRVKRMVEHSRGCRGRTYAGKILAWLIDDKGYPHVKLWRDRKERRISIHRLVAWAFIGPQLPGIVVNHKDGNKGDPRIENIEYMTKSNDILHALAVLGARRARGRDHHRAKLTEENVREIRRLLREGVIQNVKIAKMFGVTKMTIGHVKAGRVWRHVD